MSKELEVDAVDTSDALLDHCIDSALNILRKAGDPNDSDQAAYLASVWIDLGQLIATRQFNGTEWVEDDESAASNAVQAS